MSKNSKSEVPAKSTKKKEDAEIGWGQGNTFGAKKQQTIAAAKKEEDEWGLPSKRSEDVEWGAATASQPKKSAVFDKGLEDDDFGDSGKKSVFQREPSPPATKRH